MDLLEAMRGEALSLRAIESGLGEGLTVLAGYAQDGALRLALLDEQGRCRVQTERLDSICASFGWSPGGPGDGKLLYGVQWQARETLADALPSPLTDALVIATVQKALHLEMAGYGTLRALALRLGEEGVAYLLALSLDEAKASDARLTEVAETGVNQAAVEAYAAQRPRWETRR